MSNVLQAALYYAELGYPVFPCAGAVNPAPLTPHGFQDASLDPERIEAWWTEFPSACIGLAAAGLLVVDIDGPGNPWLAGDYEKAMSLAAAPTSLTPGGGRHHIFRRPAGKAWRCTVGRLAERVDTRTDGGYIVAPPSIRPDGAYRWVEGCELDVPRERLPEPPPWLVAQLDQLADRAALAPPPHTLPRVASGGAEGNSIPSGQRNATLARLGGTMRRVGMSQAEITAALLRTNADRCRPPLPLGEVERIAASVARYEPDQVATAVAEDHFGQMYARPPAEEAVENGDPGPTPEHLLCIPGFVDDVMRFTLDTAPYPERTLAFCGAIALQALLAGRKVRDDADNRTNLYVLGLANSGAGKDHPRKINQRILLEAGLAECLGNSFASGEGIEDRLFTQPASLFQVDELDGLLVKVNQAKDGRHEQVLSTLLQMYSSASGVYVMRAKAGRERTVIDQPCLCLFGTAIPKHFYESISPRMMTNGFLARMLILESQRRGQGRESHVRPVPADIAAAARWWAEYQPGDQPGNLSAWHPVPNLVPMSPEAGDALRQCREQADHEYGRAEERNDPVAMAIWARAYEKARRLALIYATSANRASPLIDADAARWACEFVEHQTRRMLFMAGSHASESDFDAKRKRMLDVLAKWHAQHGDRGMPFWMINRKLPWTMREHEEVRDTLVTQRLIDVRINQTGGRPSTVYLLAAACRENESESPSCAGE
jgi:hypothetical protein